MADQHNELNRRSFLQGGVASAAIAGAGLSAGASESTTKVQPEKIRNYQAGMQYRPVGKTGLSVSVLSLGGLVNEPGVHEYGIDHGINLVHISTSYLGGRSIVDLGRLMKTHRDKVYIALKDNFFKRSDYVKKDFSKLDQVLKTLNTDHVDFFMFNRHDEESAKDPLIGESFEAIRASGKVRFAGHTSHDRNRKATGAALKSGMFSLLMPVLNQPNLEALGSVLQDAHTQGVGIMAMKTMKGLKSLDQQCAYLKKLLKNPAITTVLKGIGSFEMFDAYQKAMNESLTEAEDMHLYRYAQANRSNNCMMCGECKEVCPQGIEISTVLRCKDYYHDQCSDRYTAMQTYHELSPRQQWYRGCEECRQCEKACPNGIDIVSRLKQARTLWV